MVCSKRQWLRVAYALGALAWIGCEAGQCPEGTARLGEECVSPTNDAGAPRFDATIPSRDAAPADSGPADGGPRDGGTPPPLPDAGPPTCTDPTTYYRDFDRDGQGDPNASVESCDPVEGFVTDARDCNDTCDACRVGAPETCDGRDNDCDGERDEEGGSRFYLDADGDGRGDPNRSTIACQAPTGHVATAGDCDDGCATCWTGAAEVCDARDNDCNGRVDDGALTRFYRDADGDRHGDPAVSIEACSAPTGFVTAGDDCSDACPTCYPGAQETCDTLDNNCVNGVDEGVRNTYYLDADRDGYGVAATTMQACVRPDGYVDRSGDCNDASNMISPGRREVCNGVDDNCSGGADETFQCVQGAAVACSFTENACTGMGSGLCTASCELPTGAACNRPPAETCDRRDDDCDGFADEGAESLGPQTLHDAVADFRRPVAVADDNNLYSFWSSDSRVFAWRLGRDGSRPANYVQIPASPNFDVDVGQRLMIAYVQNGRVFVRELNKTTLAEQGIAFDFAATGVSTVRVRTHQNMIYVFTRETNSIVRRAYFNDSLLRTSDVAPAGSTIRSFDVAGKDGRYYITSDENQSTIVVASVQPNGATSMRRVPIAPGEVLRDVGLGVEAFGRGTDREWEVVLFYAVSGASPAASHLRGTLLTESGATYPFTAATGRTTPTASGVTRTLIDVAFANNRFYAAAPLTPDGNVGASSRVQVFDVAWQGDGPRSALLNNSQSMPLSTENDGVSLVGYPTLVPSTARVLYSPVGAGIASRPIGCY